MAATPFKLLAAAVLVGGLGLGLGTGWTPTADAQPPKPSSPKPDPQAEAKRLAAELEKAQRAAEEAAKRAAESDREREADLRAWRERMVQMGYLAPPTQKGKPSAATATAKWEYDFVKANDTTLAKFVEFLRDREAGGWEFVGTTRINPVFEGGSQGAPVNTWVLRRPVKVLNFTSQAPATRAEVTDFKRGTGTVPRAGADLTEPDTGTVRPGKADDAAAIEAEIAKLQAKLAGLKGKGRVQAEAKFNPAELPLDPRELGEMLTKLAAKKFPGGRIAFQSEGTRGFRVQGDKEVVEWAVALIKKLSEK